MSIALLHERLRMRPLWRAATSADAGCRGAMRATSVATRTA